MQVTGRKEEMERQTTLDEYEKLVIRMNTPRFFNLQFSQFAFGVVVDFLAFFLAILIDA